MMNPRTSLLTLLASGSLLFAGALLAQNQPAQTVPPPPPQPQAQPQPMPPQPPQAPEPQAQPTPPQPMPPPPPAPQAQTQPTPQPQAAPQPGQDSAQYNSPQGQVTVNSSMPAVKDAGPPPDFATLANGKAYVTEADASAYPPLANDFLHASGGSQHLSKAAYARWLKQR